VYDFDGFDIGQSSLPEGDYSYGDLTYEIVANPLSASDMIGDRALKLNINWLNGYAAFGRGTSRYVEFNHNQDYLNFFFYNPVANNQNAVVSVNIADDDNASNAYENTADDVWKKLINIPGGSGWQLISIPLKDFTDGNSGGNGVFDIAFTQNKGMLLLVEFRFSKPVPSATNPVFYIDYINFSDGILPRGNNELQLPYKSPSDYCLLGAFQVEAPGQYNLIPQHFEALFNVPGKKLKYVNFYMQWATNGSTTPHALPGSALQSLITNGYTPILTWEPLFSGYAHLDPVQPRLNNILNGDYNTYIDNFADKIKLLSDTIIIRLMHEFDGDWYPWCVSQNGGDPNKFINAYRFIVDRFNAKGVTNVKWMWCGNADYKPYASYNWIVAAYPGDNYVDIVATDIYNAHYPAALPWWRSFRWQTAESYYYLQKYMPNKQIMICELGVRERQATEYTSSQSKAQWYERMDKELQSNFHKVRGLVFFNSSASQNWMVNTSSAALQSLKDNIWMDPYYFPTSIPTAVEEHEYGSGLYVYPNPNNGLVTLSYNSNQPRESFTIIIYNATGKSVYSETLNKSTDSFTKQIDLSTLAKGIYLVEMEAYSKTQKQKVKEVRKLILQ
jgi:beta-mannanase